MEITFTISGEKHSLTIWTRSALADVEDRHIEIPRFALFDVMTRLSEKYNNRKPVIAVLFDCE